MKVLGPRKKKGKFFFSELTVGGGTEAAVNNDKETSMSHNQFWPWLSAYYDGACGAATTMVAAPLSVATSVAHWITISMQQ